MTDKYPDVLQLVVNLMEPAEGREQVESFVMDAEIVAIDADTGDLLNFQTLSNRARKDVQIGDVKVKAKVFAFDLMHLNGKVSSSGCGG
jgi:DNA ligase-1